MPHTKVQLNVYLPTTSMSRVNDFILAFVGIAKDHKGTDPFVVFSGPFPEIPESERTGNVERSEAREQPAREPHQQAAADDFADGPEDGADPEPGKRTRKPRSDAGKPRGPRGGDGEAGAGPSGKAEGGRERSGRAEAGDAAERNGARGASQGGGRRSGEGEGEGGRRTQRGRGTGSTVAGDGEAAPVADDWDSNDGDDWNSAPAKEDEGPEEDRELWAARSAGTFWPDDLMPEGEITRETLSGLMSEHFRAHGGKQKSLTFKLIEDVCNADNLANVSDEDFDALARALLKDTAKYRHGLKKPVTAAKAA